VVCTQGDVLVRCRHLTAKGARVSMFRAAFHTGYVPCGVLRLSKAQLDGACADDRFDDDFFVDLIFAPSVASAQPPPPPPSADQGKDAPTTAAPANVATDADADPHAATAASEATGAGEAAATVNTALLRRERGLVVEPDATAAYDAMLHRDGKEGREVQLLLETTIRTIQPH